MSRILALDIGSVRIGAAVSDPSEIIAQGLGVWDSKTWLSDFESALEKYDPALIVIGLPVRTDGKVSEAGDRISGLVDELRVSYPERKFVTWDERFTTVIANRMLIEADVSRKKRKSHVDKIAAVLILESWLES
ncbi:MAG: Holliday junction resolvase RuvX, partial [Synergistaceae bacterium]|nr:Holliday junction resolvase RuvX [Synergistaceae bacterium]